MLVTSPESQLCLSHLTIRIINIIQISYLNYMTRSGLAARIQHLIPKPTPSTHQTITYALFILQNYLFQLQRQPLVQYSLTIVILQIWHYVLIAYLFYEIKVVTTNDTRDPILQMAKNFYDFDENQLSFCIMCNSIVLKTSYHCWRCGKCSNNLDHHCKYLNCCIAQSNYIPFLRLLIIFIFYSADILILLLINYRLTLWVAFILAVSAIQTLLAIGLLVFHIFLSRCYNGSTLNFCLSKVNKKSQPIQLQEQTIMFT